MLYAAIAHVSNMGFFSDSIKGCGKIYIAGLESPYMHDES
jgi:hypothetical protein